MDLLPVLIVLALMQFIAYFSARSVLGADAGWSVNNLLGFSCLTVVWGSFYAGFFWGSFVVWLVVFSCGTALVIYGHRRRSSFSISIKQGALIFGGVVLRLVGAAAVLGAVAGGLISLLKGAATLGQANW
jgi:hypothetical protein